MATPRTVYVSNATELKAAIAGRTDNTTIVLKEGDYGTLSINERGSLKPLVLVSENPAKPAIFESLTITNANGVKIDGLQFTPEKTGKESWAGSGLTVRNSNGVEVVNSKFVGTDGSFEDSARGMTIFDSKNVVVENNSFTGLMRGGVLYNIDNLDVNHNTITNMRSEGFNFSAVKNVEISYNKMSDFHPFAGDHADFIQFWTRGAITESSNIHIHHNELVEKKASVQGIFMDNDDGIPYRNVVIEDNFIQTNAPRGITLEEAYGATIKNNIAIATEGADYKVSIHVTESSGVTLLGNTANAFNLKDSLLLTNTGNVSVAMTLGGKVTTPADAEWARETMNVVQGTAGDDRLAGTSQGDFMEGGRGADVINSGAGNDVVYGGSGNDMMNGGAGADRFVFKAADLAGKESDRLFDLNFAEGDVLDFTGFAALGSSAEATKSITSWTALAELAKDADVFVARKGTTDLLTVTIVEAPDKIQEIQLSNAYKAYTDAGGLLI